MDRDLHRFQHPSSITLACTHASAETGGRAFAGSGQRRRDVAGVRGALSPDRSPREELYLRSGDAIMGWAHAT